MKSAQRLAWFLAATLTVQVYTDACADDLLRGPIGSLVVPSLLTSSLFNTPQDASSTLDTQVPQAEFAPPKTATDGFTVKLAVDLKEFEGERHILEIPGVLDVLLRQHDPLDRNRQNYPAFKMPDGSVPVLEATLTLHSIEHPDWKQMTIGIPLAMLAQPTGTHEIVLNFSGADWKMYVDGEMLDNDFPFGYPQWAATTTWKLNKEYVRNAAIYIPGLQQRKQLARTADTTHGIQYWLPRGHNSWVGDVATIYHQGRYHVFYLYDRRHHQSKFGCGAHYFEHLSTTDFKTWTEHAAATPLEDQWECIGTGMPFIFNGKLHLSYGLHTTRVYPQEKTTLPAQWDYLKQHGRTGSFERAKTPGVPAGSTYAVSADGISNFQKSQIMFHPCENPTVYTAPSGKLRLLANYRSNGTWDSESLEGGWHCTQPDFPPGGDCTIFFRWGKFDYIAGGFGGMWSKPADAADTAYQDLVRQGLDFYDGSNVPSVTQIGDNRFLMAAWIPIRGWGGPLVIRELVQYPDGRIGSKWMQEITPDTGQPIALATSLTDTQPYTTDTEAFMLLFNVRSTESKKSKVGIAFLPADGEQSACELQIRPGDLRAQFGPGSLTGFAAGEKSLREQGVPHGAGNYAIENLLGVNGSFSVRVIVKNDTKIGGALIDAEIAGQRTMISHRPDLTVRKMVFRAEGAELTDIRIAPLTPQTPAQPPSVE